MRYKILIIIAGLLLVASPHMASAYTPVDPMFVLQNYLSQIHAEKAWDLSRGDDVVVAVLDSGVDIKHPDLEKNIWTNKDEIEGDGIDNDNNGFIDDIHGWDFAENNNDPRPKVTADYVLESMHHGTAIAGLIAATEGNNFGMVGEAFRAKIMPLRIFNSKGESSISNLVRGINYAVDNGANIINLSLMGIGSGENLQLKTALQNAERKGVFVSVASGNGKDGVGIDLDKEMSYPASYGNSKPYSVTTVSSVDSAGAQSAFANYGSCVDVWAPGENMDSAAYYDGEKFKSYYLYGWEGTSFSTAMVSGAAALLKSKYDSITPEEINRVLKLSSTSLTQSPKGDSGQLDVAAALEKAATIVGGSIVKLKDFPAVYRVDNNKVRHLFSSESVYWTWHSGSWADQKVKTISQEEFDNLIPGPNEVVKEDSIIQFSNSSKMYTVSIRTGLCSIDEQTASSTIGSNWKQKIITIPEGFESDYIHDYTCTVK